MVHSHRPNVVIITSAEGSYVFTVLRSVCLFVCLFVCPSSYGRNSRSILMKLCTVVWNPKSTIEFVGSQNQTTHSPIFPQAKFSLYYWRRITEKLWTHFDEISWRGRAWPRNQVVKFWRRSGSLSGSRSRKSETGFTGLSIKLPTDFDEILWRAGVWPRDQLITLVTILITMRIRESVQDHDPDPGRTATIILLCWRFGEGLCFLSTSSCS